MQIRVGTSGYSYKEWKGTFYPDKLPAAKMLRFYAERFSTVEINATFRRVPSEAQLKSWATEVPASFQIVLKAPQFITHMKRLKDVDGPTGEFMQIASVLKRHLGPVLFQLPPNFKKDVPRLQSFLKLIKGRRRTAFEFRHESWFDDEVYACLRKQKCALCIADTDEAKRATEIISTSDWGYLRLRRKSYSAPQLRKWIAKIRSQGWKQAYVFFKHEDSGAGPRLAQRLLELVEE
jgi:uncharacterized protein YecE (DUF72 family)